VGSTLCARTMTMFELNTCLAELWEGLSKGYTQKLPFALKELYDNTLAAAASCVGNLDMVTDITERADSRYEIVVSDSGPGIAISDLSNALSIGKAKRSGLNEHGYGLKNVLAFCCAPNTPNLWSIVTRPAGSDKAYRISAPWTSPMECKEVPLSEHPYSSGVTIRMTTSVEVIRCYPGSNGRPKMALLTKHLRHCMGVAYAFHPLMVHPERSLTFKVNGQLIRPELPQDARIALGPIRETISLADSAPPVTIEFTHYRLDSANKDATEYYKRNMSSSGFYLYFFDRLIKRIPPGEMYGMEAVSHNDFNPLVGIVKLSGDPTGIPPTMTTKNGLIETSPLTQGLFQYIRDKVPIANARDPKIDGRDRSEAEMVRDYINRMEPLLQDLPGCYIEENKTYEMDNGEKTPPFDVVVHRGTTLTIMEAKKKTLDMDAVGQIWRNVRFARRVPVFQGLPIKGMLVARTRDMASLARILLEEYKTVDPTFVCDVKTWCDLGIGTAN